MIHPNLKNRTTSALIARGIDTETAQRLSYEGLTLRALQSKLDNELFGIGLSTEQIANVRQSSRPPIPFSTVLQVVWANRFICCVCREAGKAVILHHIVPWAESHDHMPENLAMVCLEHHAQAHRMGTLEQNLNTRLLRGLKKEWEAQVSMLDAGAVLQAGRNPAYHWWWLNHARILDMARAAGINVTKTAYFWQAKEHAHLSADGSFGSATYSRDYLYQGGDGILLYEFMVQLLASVIEQSSIFDISSDLDRSVLSRIVSVGDLLLIRGRHHFRMLDRRDSGPGQASEVRRKANGVEVSFIIDRWEAVSNSSFHGWLRGTQSASSIVRVVSVESAGDMLRLRCTGIAIGGHMPNFPVRSYFSRSCPIDRYADDEEFV